ncbi:leucine zipper domain-containing protein [Sanguibacter suarezii]|uniref:leucine zipper domain-containing protein n=1 Tax=Sanguibacter suarezii TaxID=60921 RepID=UPI0009FEEA3E
MAGGPRGQVAGHLARARHRWARRFRSEVPAGLLDRSSGPHAMPAKTVLAREQFMLAARPGPDAVRSPARCHGRPSTHHLPHPDPTRSHAVGLVRPHHWATSSAPPGQPCAATNACRRRVNTDPVASDES